MNALLWIKDGYWLHRGMIAASAAGGLFAASQLLLVLWTLRRLRELSHMRERMSRLTDGLALLTDTTEAGLAAVAREVERLNPRKTLVKPASRAHVSRRVVAAARAGEEISQIAESEALSESEVRLHLTLAEANARELRRAASIGA